MGPEVCQSWWEIHVTFHFVDDDSPLYSAKELTDEAVIWLIQACPNLRHIQLQGVSKLTDLALFAVFRYCQDIETIEISGTCYDHNRLKGAALDSLRANPDWAFNLKKLIIPKNDNRVFMKSMRDLSMERDDLKIQLVDVDLGRLSWKEGGDSYLRRKFTHYVDGRKSDTTSWPNDWKAPPSRKKNRRLNRYSEPWEPYWSSELPMRNGLGMVDTSLLRT